MRLHSGIGLDCRLAAWWWLASGFLLLTSAGGAQAQELKYQWQPKQKFSYNMTITVDEDERVTTFKGTVHYTVDSANAEQSRLTYRGGLSETSQAKPRERPAGGALGAPFGPRGFPHVPHFGLSSSPFARPSFAGKIQTTNRITITPIGQVLALEGDSQLPFLLGNVSLLPFESLPKANEREWILDSGVSISEEQGSGRPFGPFGPQFDSGNKSIQAASEVTRYSIQSEKGDLVTIKKSYQLTAPPAGNGEAFDMSGAGTWVFNKKDRVPESLDMNFKLIVKEGNSSTTLPITVKFTRLSAAEMAKIEADAQKAREEHERKLAEEKVKSETPLTAAEKQRALAALSGQDEAELKKVLGELQAKSLAEPDPEVASAIERFINHPDPTIREASRKALVKWSPAFKRKYDLDKAYEGPSPVASTDLSVESSTPLFVGQIVQVQENGSFWFPGRIKSLLPSGKVEVEFLSWGKPSRSAVLARRNLQLAPAEVDQPAKPSGPVVAGDAMHTWSDSTGRFQVTAEFVTLENDKVRLRRHDGRTIDVPVEKLSPADQTRVRQLAERQSLASENPFEPQ